MDTIKAAFLIVISILATGVLVRLWNLLPAAAAEAGSMALLCVRGAGIGVAAVTGVLLLWFVARQRHERLRQRDGAFALQVFWLVPWTVRFLNFVIGRPSPRVVYDPNLNASHAAVIHDQIYTVTPGGGWDRQLTYAENIERTRRAQAVAVGDAALSLPWVRAARGGVPNAATGRLLAGAYDKAPKQISGPVDAPDPAVPPALLDLESAMRETTPARWLLGQNRDTGDLAVWAPDSSPHVAVVGSSGSGKTESSVEQLIVSARRNRWHVAILDPVGGADLGVFRDKAEWLESSPDVFPDQLRALAGVVAERRSMLAAAGVARLADVPGAPAQVLCLIDEFGLLMSGLRGAALATAEGILSDIVRVGRKYGVHLALCDQDKSRWPNTMIDGVSPTLTYRMADYGGSRVRAYNADTLGVGTFVMGRRVFDAWHVAPQLPRILAVMPAQRGRVIEGRSGVRGGEGVGVPPDVASAPNARTNGDFDGQPNGVAAPVDAVPTDLQAAVWSWRDANPTGAQADLRRAFAASGIEIARGYAHECWHAWPAARLAQMEAGTISAEGMKALFAAGVVGAAPAPAADTVRVEWNQGG